MTPSPQLVSPYVWRAPASIPRREWIYGRHYLRKFVSATIAPGGVGKSSLLTIEALAIASGRNLLGIQPSRPFRVWMWNGEDPLEEVERKIAAACIHYGIVPSELEGRLFINSGRTTEIILASQAKTGTVVAEPLVDDLTRCLSENEIDVVIVDPFVSSHRVTENDNGAIDAVTKTWNRIAETTNCSVELAHHSRKTYGAEVSVEDGRGASALLATARAARVFNGMSKDEAEKAGLEKPWGYFRSDDGKANLTPVGDKADWYRLISVSLGNGAGAPDDLVGVVTPWEWPNPFDNITTADLLASQRAIATGGPWREDSQAKDWVGKPIAVALHLNPDSKAHKHKIKGLIKIWTASGALHVVEGQDGKRMTKNFIEVGEWANE